MIIIIDFFVLANAEIKEPPPVTLIEVVKKPKPILKRRGGGGPGIFRDKKTNPCDNPQPPKCVPCCPVDVCTDNPCVYFTPPCSPVFYC